VVTLAVVIRPIRVLLVRRPNRIPGLAAAIDDLPKLSRESTPQFRV
jgi:hypothetical protein